MFVFFDPLLNTLAGRAVRPSLFTDDLKGSFNLSGLGRIGNTRATV